MNAQKTPIIDCHIHFPHYSLMDQLIKVADQANFDRFNIVCTPDQARMSLVPDALHLKAHFPERVFVFGGLDVSAYFRAAQAAGEIFAQNVDYLSLLGCDGIKMIEGKPQMRQMLPIPDFDTPTLAPYWHKLAESQFPLVWHVNDPEEFWDRARIPSWALERGWYYSGGGFVNNEAQYTQVLNVLKRNPRLKVIFAHFFFMSAQLPRLSRILDEYPNACVDLTPGVEMYFNFSVNLAATRDFFLRYQDRILFGTDIGAKALLVDPSQGIQPAESLERVNLIRRFLESDGEFTLNSESGFLFGNSGTPLHGIALPEDVLQKIYCKNFERVVSSRPRAVNAPAVIEFCAQLEQMIEAQGLTAPGVRPDALVAKAVRTHFESL